jgi:hypothetical protein
MTIAIMIMVSRVLRVLYISSIKESMQDNVPLVNSIRLLGG